MALIGPISHTKASSSVLIEAPNGPEAICVYDRILHCTWVVPRFHAVWGQIELTIDCAIWKAMGTETAQQAHKRVAGMKFSNKLKKLRTMIDNGKFKHGEKVKDLLRQIEDESRRNVFAHSILASDEHSVTFVHRSVQHGKYKVERHTVSGGGFVEHAQYFVQIADDLLHAAGLSDREVRDFAAALIP